MSGRIGKGEAFGYFMAVIGVTFSFSPFLFGISSDRTGLIITFPINKGLACGIVFSNEHYNGDVPYLGGNTNITVESVAGIIGKNGFHILAGLEGGMSPSSLPADRMQRCIRYRCFSLLMRIIR